MDGKRGRDMPSFHFKMKLAPVTKHALRLVSTSLRMRQDTSA